MRKLLALLLVFAILALSLAACDFNSLRLITSQESPDGDYTLLLYQAGIPAWPYGSVEAELVLMNHLGFSVAELRISLANDGGNVSERNIVQISWLDDCVEIVMREFDSQDQFRYVLAYQ